MRRSSADGQIEPLAALAAVGVVAVALAVFAGAFGESVPPERDRNVAADAADRVERSLSDGGVVRMADLAGSLPDGPEGYELNVTLAAGTTEKSVGPIAPATASLASRRVSVAVPGGEIVPGRLEVRVWR